MKRELGLMGLLLVASALIVSSLSAMTASERQGYGQAQPLVDLALADLRERLGASDAAIEVRSVKAVEFSDSSLGVPEPGKMYLTVITPGYVVRLAVGGRVYEYHGSDMRVVLAK